MESAIDKRQIVIVGGGIIGCCSAYYITCHPLFNRNLHTVVLLEAAEIAGAASGKAGGLVATWADPKCIALLSYRLHSDLTAKHGGEKAWGYRNVHCADVDCMGEAVGHTETQHGEFKFHFSTSTEPKNAILPAELNWVHPEKVSSYAELGDPSNTAQLHPYLFTNEIARHAQEQGTQIIFGSLTELKYSNDKSMVKSVVYTLKQDSEPREQAATDVVIACGPWTKFVYPKAPIKESRNHSTVVLPAGPLSPYVLFPELHPKIPQQRIPPEIYPRPDGTVYCCGPSDQNTPLPENSELVEVEEEVCDTIYRDVCSISNELHGSDVLIKQACYRPIVIGRDRAIGPLVGKTDVQGLWLAAGHDSWGISNGPATGKVISEMILEGKAKSADVASLDPRLVLQQS